VIAVWPPTVTETPASFSPETESVTVPEIAPVVMPWAAAGAVKINNKPMIKNAQRIEHT
jgi:hypothetical protein